MYSENPVHPVYADVRSAIGAAEPSDENPFEVSYGNLVFSGGCDSTISFLLPEPLPQEIEYLKDTLRNAAGGNTDGALARMPLSCLNSPFRAVKVTEAMDAWLNENRQEFASDDFNEFLFRILTESDQPEAVKFALYIYGNYGRRQERFDPVIKDYLLFSDFCGFAIDAVQSMENGNALLFEIVKQSSGHGLVDIVSRLEPETKEIEDWIFRYGTDGFLGYYYTSVAITRKCHLKERMEDPNLSDEDYRIICDVVEGYHEEGLALDFDKLPDPRGIFRAFFRLVRSRLTVYSVCTVMRIRRDVDHVCEHHRRHNGNKNPAFGQFIIDECDDILSPSYLDPYILSHLNEDDWYSLACHRGLIPDENIAARILGDRSLDSFRFWQELRDRSAYSAKLSEFLRDPEISETAAERLKKDESFGMDAVRFLMETEDFASPLIPLFLHSWDDILQLALAENLIREADEGNPVPEDVLSFARQISKEAEQNEEDPIFS